MIAVEWCEPADGPRLRALLDPVERARADAFVREQDAARFVTGRVLLRTVAGRLLGTAPHAVPVRVRCAVCGGPHGKPSVQGVETSLAHSGDRVVLAWRERGAVGVDVEQRRDDLEPGVADLVLAPGERAADLLATWARKEAVLKLRGTGFAEPMTGVDLTDPGTRVRDLDLGPGYVAALASRDDDRVVVRRVRTAPPW